MLIIGIDPGIKGAICILKDGKISDVFDMPIMPIGKKNKSQVNASPQGLNLEAGDAITVQAATGSSKIQGLISYALINRENENG